jgi:hypothetical protein
MKKNFSIKKINAKKNVKQNTRKNNKKIQKTKKNKYLIGGKPKINFPYTYFIINFDKFKQYFETLNPYLFVQTNACDNISLGQNPEFTYEERKSYLNNSNEYCVLVLKYDDVFALNNNQNLLNDLNFLNKILGHAKLIHFKSLSLLGIYNVCLHTFNIIKNQQGNISYQQKQTKPGYESVLFNCIMTSIYFLNINAGRYWLGININNVQFNKIAWLYTSKGFEKPIYSNISPDKSILPFYFIQLTSRGHYINNQDEALIPYFETIDLYNQIKTPLGKEGIFLLKFYFDKSAILSLRLMPFLSFTQTKIPIGIEDYAMQRESAGIFLIYNSYQDKNSNEINNILSLETLSDNSLIKYNVGEVGSVNIEGSKIFHTHPFINYKNYNVLIGTPSGNDLASFLQNFINDIKLPMSEMPQFGTVIAIEGIYIYSLSIDGIRFFKNGTLPNINDIINNYEYPYNQRAYDWSTYEYTDTDIQLELVNNAIQKYLIWFDTTNKRFGNLFDLIFKPWKEIDHETEFKIHYYNGNRFNIGEDIMDVVLNQTSMKSNTTPTQTKLWAIRRGKNSNEEAGYNTMGDDDDDI